MTFLEKDLENIIWESDNDDLSDRGFHIQGKKLRQLRIGRYGICDLLSIKRCYIDGVSTVQPYLDITVYELKKEKVGVAAFLQALRYVKGISYYLAKHRPNTQFNFHIVLAAKEVDKVCDFIFLPDFINDDSNWPSGTIRSLKLYSFEYALDGMKFKEHSGYHLTNPGF